MYLCAECAVDPLQCVCTGQCGQHEEGTVCSRGKNKKPNAGRAEFENMCRDCFKDVHGEQARCVCLGDKDQCKRSDEHNRQCERFWVDNRTRQWKEAMQLRLCPGCYGVDKKMCEACGEALEGRDYEKAGLCANCVPLRREAGRWCVCKRT